MGRIVVICFLQVKMQEIWSLIPKIDTSNCNSVTYFFLSIHLISFIAVLKVH